MLPLAAPVEDPPPPRPALIIRFPPAIAPEVELDPPVDMVILPGTIAPAVSDIVSITTLDRIAFPLKITLESLPPNKYKTPFAGVDPPIPAPVEIVTSPPAATPVVKREAAPEVIVIAPPAAADDTELPAVASGAFSSRVVPTTDAAACGAGALLMLTVPPATALVILAPKTAEAVATCSSQGLPLASRIEVVIHGEVIRASPLPKV
jgi:hypothetical protein